MSYDFPEGPDFNPEPIEEDSTEDAENEDAYDIHDPKGPKYHSTHADLWDQREGK